MFTCFQKKEEFNRKSLMERKSALEGQADHGQVQVEVDGAKDKEGEKKEEGTSK